MTTNFDFKDSTNLIKNSSNCQNSNQLKIDIFDRNYNLKANSSVISNDTFTHFKKQKIQNLYNENKTSNKYLTNFTFSESSSSPDLNRFSPELKDQQNPVNLIKTNSPNLSINIQDTCSSSSNSYSSNENKEDTQQDILKVNNNSVYLSNQLSLTPSTNNDKKVNFDKIELRFIKQPAKYHRARYMTEGSRGPIRDKSGKSFPTIKLIGYNKKPVKAFCYLTDDKQIDQPHLFYQASKLTSRCLTNCLEMKLGNTIALQFELNPRNDMELIIDCLGIVKQRLFEIQQQQHNQEKSHFKTPYCRLVFECYIEEYNHILKTYSDTIHCKQMMRAPEIHRMSTKECHFLGDKELFIIGKNFTKDVKLLFCYENHWQEQVTPIKELLHQAHLVCKVPKIDVNIINKFAEAYTDKDGRTSRRLNVEVYAICDNKQSSKELFFYYL